MIIMSLINHINGIDDSIVVTEGIISDSFHKIVDVFGDACKSTYAWYLDSFQKTLEQFLKYNPDSSVKESLLEEAYKYI